MRAPAIPALEDEVQSLLAREPGSGPFLEVSALDDAPFAVASPVGVHESTASPVDRVAHYRIVRRLGEGGMGVVYEAFDERLERPVALKLLRHDAADPSAGDRLTREARIAARVVHPCASPVRSTTWARRPVGGSSRWSWWREVPRQSAGPRSVAPGRGPAHGHRHSRCPRRYCTATASCTATSSRRTSSCPVGVKLLDFGLARPLHAQATSPDSR